jgi:DNA modification methylase
MWPQTERLYVFRHHSSGDNYQLRNTSRLPQRSDIWKIDRAKRNGHNCPFPETLAEAVILAWSPVGGVVCDPYAGSGTTGIVARALGRTFVGAEALPMYQERFAKTSRLVSFMERVQ